VLHRLYGFLGRQYGVCEKSEIDQRSRIAIAPFGVLWSRRRIFCDGYLESMRFRGLEDAFHVLNSIVFLKAFADQGPRESFFAQDVILRIDEYNCSVFPVNFHSDFWFEFSGGRDRFKNRSRDPNKKESNCQLVLPEEFFDPARDFLSVRFECKMPRI
jgi:hypothetical protein